MSGMAARAERIAAHLVARETGAVVTRHDCGGRQGAVDFLINWPDGRQGCLEVTLITEPKSAAWQGMAAKEGWRWPAGTSWEFRAGRVSFPYRRTRRAVLRAIELCDLWSVDDPRDLPAEVSTIRSSIGGKGGCSLRLREEVQAVYPRDVEWP